MPEFKVWTKDQRHTKFNEEKEKTWSEPFYFIQGADPQYGLIQRYIEKNPEPGWSKETELTKISVQKINALNPKPKFFVICGDLCDQVPDTDANAELRKLQEKTFIEVYSKIDADIPLVCVCGNHDVGDSPRLMTLHWYRKSFGDDYFSFWAGGVHFIVLNSQYYHDSSNVPYEFIKQQEWLDKELELSKNSRHGPVIFQHIPWFLSDPDATDTGYFAIDHNVRKPMLEKLHNAGVRYVFAGHYHRNSGGMYKHMENVVTSAIGGQLGEDKSGLRIVKVQSHKISHEYFAFEDMPTTVTF